MQSNGEKVKAEWMKLHGDCFEPLTFEELDVGQQFICFPTPGDNDGHGGFRGPHYLFTKTREKVPDESLKYPQGAAIKIGRVYEDYFPHHMYVVAVD